MAYLQTNSIIIDNATQNLSLVTKHTDGFQPTKLISGNVEWTPTSVGDKLLICRIPINAKIHSLKIFNDDLGGTITGELGVHEPTETNDAVGDEIDDNLFATAINLGVLTADYVDYRFSALNHATNDLTLWELAGKTQAQVESDGFGDYTLVLNAAVATTPNAGTISYEIVISSV